MKFGENWDIHFCILLLEVQEGQFGARNTDFGVGGGDEIITPLHVLVF